MNDNIKGDLDLMSTIRSQVVRQRLNMRRCLYNYLLISHLSPTYYLNYYPPVISIIIHLLSQLLSTYYLNYYPPVILIIAYLCAYRLIGGLAGGLVGGLAGIIYNLSGLEETVEQ